MDAETATPLLAVPDGACELDGQFCSNFDHRVNVEIADRLKQGGWAPYPAWDWWGRVWFADGRYHCEIKRYKVHVDTVSADTPADLVRACSDKWGWK